MNCSGNDELIVTDSTLCTLEVQPASELGNQPEACLSKTCGREGPTKRLAACSVLVLSVNGSVNTERSKVA